MLVGKEQESLRPNRSELTVLGWAFGISLAIHLVTYGTYDLGKHFGWWKAIHLPAWLKKSRIEMAFAEKTQADQLAADRIPTMFIETTPIQTVAEPPKNAKFYSDKNTAAANPDADQETDVPKINGTQTKINKTEDTPRHDNVQSLRPSPPTPELRSKRAETSGDLAFAKPSNGRDDEGRPEHVRPRTLIEAQPSPSSKIVGQKMKQDGGVRRRLDFSAVDAKATPFGAYDLAFIEAVQQRWYDLLDSRDFVRGRQGRVQLEFRLNYDGRVTDVRVVDNNVGEVLALLCQKAVLDPSPFAAWPSDMRRMLGDSRRLQFTFFYE